MRFLAICFCILEGFTLLAIPVMLIVRSVGWIVAGNGRWVVEDTWCDMPEVVGWCCQLIISAGGAYDC